MQTNIVLVVIGVAFIVVSGLVIATSLAGLLIKIGFWIGVACLIVAIIRAFKRYVAKEFDRTPKP